MSARLLVPVVRLWRSLVGCALIEGSGVDVRSCGIVDMACHVVEKVEDVREWSGIWEVVWHMKGATLRHRCRIRVDYDG